MLDVPLPDEDRSLSVNITRAHLEEDSGKLVHAGAAGLAGSTHSLADYNRAGAPLLEVVSAPDMRSGREAAAYAAELQRVVRSLAVSDGAMAEGSFRVDVNVSLRPAGSNTLGTKVEVKNLNSFSAIARAVDFEVARQAELLRPGGASGGVRQETRLWDEGGQKTVAMRSKEGLADYRYCPEPDLPPLRLSLAGDSRTAVLPELPREARERFEALGIPPKDAFVLADAAELGAFLTACLQLPSAEGVARDPRELAKWLLGDVTGLLKSERLALSATRLAPSALVELLDLVAKGTLSGKMAKEALPALLRDGCSPAALGAAGGQLSDEGELRELVRSVLAESAKQVAEYRGGKDKLKGYFTGAIMKRSGGRANPRLADKLLMEALAAPADT